ncbi:MAG TPA: hypothetical protein VM580_15185, partial [Labilithrix sp.]|nr:hypothetical protein [Labilithrix sp.]
MPGSNIGDAVMARARSEASPRDIFTGSADARVVTSVPNAVLDAGRALASGEPLRALGLVGRVHSALGLTMRGIAYAQLGDLELARSTLERASSTSIDPRTGARARAALVELALS